MKRKGFGAEDAPFMILAAVAVMMVVTWIGINAMASFGEGNERQAAVDASTEIYKRAKLVSLGYDGSSERIGLSIPRGYAMRIEGSIVALGGVVNGSTDNATELTEPMVVQGIHIVGNDSDIMSEGMHNIVLVYSARDDKVIVSWN